MFVCKEENFDTGKDLLNSKNKDSVNTLAFCLIIFVGMHIVVVFSRFKIFFLIPDFRLLSNVNWLSLPFSLSPNAGMVFIFH